ncbi:MAG: chromosome segregation protein SMC [Ilumatobacter coccineus]|uniref:Chromosome partition protein Smc n=1 Tax=Ilumatobacter coccineus TaxID=467094 RepID=A0A2G6KAR5_9ACTN|nr:MAG: chromosome segregation protein SMC [Ilumatobacter coccineus]
MFLKSLTLKGFKSFADATTIHLEPGVTVVVGPNGSGKSNVVDAVAWVLGAQAPRSIRSQKMDDVIFAGTDKRSALGRAEVSLTLDNSSGLIPVEFNEVTITRTLFRSGDSEYSINQVPCRLLDIQELLSDAGVGRQQHVIVSQGQIDAVLNARPEDRRAIIEEAAGVLKFRKRKEKAERRLAATEANLMRLQDLVREVRRQLRPLERQAKAAQRHGDLVEELAEVRTYVAGRQIASYRLKLEAIANDRRAATEATDQITSELATLDTEVMALEAQLAARGESDISDRLMKVERMRERSRGLSAVLGERRRSLERDLDQLIDAGLVARLESEGAALRSEREEVVAAQRAADTERDEVNAAEEAVRAERELALSVIETDDSEVSAAAAAAEVRGELRSARNGAVRAEAVVAQADHRIAALDHRIAAIATRIADAQADLAEADQEEADLVARADLAVDAHRRASEARVAAAEARQRQAEVASGWAARVEAFQAALDAAHSRAGAERLSQIDGVLGTLLDLVEIDDGWQNAVEAALGEALSAVVVDGPDSARRALDALIDSDTEGAVVVAGHGTARSRRQRVGEPVINHVRSGRPGLSRLLDELIGDAVRADGIEEAIEFALAHPDLVVVTARGDRFAASGWRVGAAAGGATAAALADARHQASSAIEALDQADHDLSAAIEAEHGAASAETEAVGRRDANRSRRAQAADTVERETARHAEIESELASQRQARAESVEVAQAQRARVADLEAVLPGLETAEHDEAAAARKRNDDRIDLEARTRLVATRRRELDVTIASLVERRQFLDQQIADNEQRLAASAIARAKADAQRVEIETAVTALVRTERLISAHRQVIDAEHDDLVDQRRRQSEEVRALSTTLEQARASRVAAEKRLDESRQRRHRADIDEAEARLRLETAIEALRRDLDIEPETAEAAPQPELPEGSTPAGRVRELERELRSLGPINPLALEEFNELQQRHEFLDAQLADVRTTRRDLSRVIRKVDQEIQNVFAAAYGDVSANFGHLFTMLFPGGSGALKLTDPDDLLNTGIEVEAKPSGKNIKKLSLLSGGERSLTALAFLFAVFRSRPSPFYVMDEVEAALDDINLRRFLGLIDEFRKDAQLLIVSHQKRTMEAGDCLVGVSMKSGGSSKVVVERT